MTRFARAKGSKASNERTPEEATSWSEMKQQLLDRNKHLDEAKKQEKANQQRDVIYKAFLKEVEDEKLQNSKWAEFPSQEHKKHKAVKRKLSEKDETVAKKLKKAPKVEQTPVEQPKQAKSNKSGTQCMKKKTTVKVVVGKVIKKTDKKMLKKMKKRALPEAVTQGESVKQQSKEKKLKSVKKTNVEAVATKTNKRTDKKLLKKVKKEQKKIIDVNSLPEEDQKKIAKKKEKRLRQLEKKMLKKQPSKSNKKEASGDKPQRRKQLDDKWIVNGKVVPVSYVDGFPIKTEDADRLYDLRKQMISKGLPRSQIKVALKLERRKAEKAFAREKKKVCFNCRLSGHNLSECPRIGKELAETSGTGICFKCGSTEHTHFECKVVRGQQYKFASCFVCKEQGHIARQCPDNARGLYPKGGACNVCGDVTHLKKDCPKYQMQQQQLQSVHLETINGGNPDALSNAQEGSNREVPKRINKVVKF